MKWKAWIFALATVGCATVDKQVQEERLQCFEMVWSRIYEKHYDPQFNGVDWLALRELYRPKVMAAETEREYYGTLNQMLGELKQSHVGISPPEKPRKSNGKPATSTETQDPGENSSSGDTNSAAPSTDEGDVGFEIDLVEGRATVTRIKQDSKAAAGPLRPGLIVTHVDGVPVPALSSVRGQTQHSSDLIERLKILRGTRARLAGKPGSLVQIGVTDGSSEEKLTVEREPASGEKATLGNLTLRTEFESKTLENGIGYIRFNCFMMNLLPKIQSAIKSFQNSPGLIFDLRGNPGGVAGMVSPIAAMLLKERTDLGTMQIRGGEMKFPVFPRKEVFEGPIAVLIDSLSGSTSEMFAGSLQEIGRVFVVGSQSAGAVLPSVIERLPNGALFQYITADFKTPKGNFLEGKGVEPDLKMELTQKEILAGKDPVLELAVSEIWKRKK